MELDPAYGKAPLRLGAAREALGQWALASEAYLLAAQLDSILAPAALAASKRCRAKQYMEDLVISGST